MVKWEFERRKMIRNSESFPKELSMREKGKGVEVLLSNLSIQFETNKEKQWLKMRISRVPR